MGTGTSPDAEFAGSARAGSEPVPIFRLTVARSVDCEPQRHKDTNSIGEIIKGRLGRSYEATELDQLRHKRQR
jgi:hypothetical protein